MFEQFTDGQSGQEAKQWSVLALLLGDQCWLVLSCRDIMCVCLLSNGVIVQATLIGVEHSDKLHVVSHPPHYNT